MKTTIRVAEAMMTVFSPSPIKSRELWSFAAVVFLNTLLCRDTWKNLDGAEPRIADALT